MSYESAKAEGRRPTDAERAKHWREEARKIFDNPEYYTKINTKEETITALRTLLKAVRYSIRCPESYSIVDWAEQIEKKLYPEEARVS